MENAASGEHGTSEPVLALLSGFNGQSDAVEIAYRALDLAAAVYRLPHAHLLLRADSSSPQVFTLGRGHLTVHWAEDFARRPSGLYATAGGDAAGVPITVADTVTGYCEMALSGHVARTRAATDVTSGLQARTMTDEIVRRAAGRSARYRWPFAVVLVTTTGPGAPGARWQLLASALRRSLRTSDEAGVAGPGRAMAVLANSGSDGVEPFLRRLRETLAERGGDIHLVAGAASAPAESVDPEQLWHLCESRLADVAGRDGLELDLRPRPRPLAVSEVELGLRCLPGVLAVDSTALADDHLTVVVRAGHGDLLPSASALAAEALGPGMTVTLLESGDQPAPSTLRRTGGTAEAPAPVRERPPGPSGATSLPDVAVAAGGEPAGSTEVLGRSEGDVHLEGRRVVLLHTRFDRSTGGSEVSVRWQDNRTVGRASGSPLASAAQATLAAVEALGTDISYYLTSVDRTTSAPGSPVVVTLAERRPTGEPGGNRRLGVAVAADEVEAASRATLSALNRLLSKAQTRR